MNHTIKIHHDVNRIEGFSDAVFGFALTLLVVSLEVPESFEQLQESVRGFLPFALTFAMVCWIWFEHHLFFRKFGLQDGWIVVLNCVLLFVVVFYVYPLKFMTKWLVDIFSGRPFIRLDFSQSRELLMLYSLGVVLIFLVFVLFYYRAWRLRLVLELTPEQVLSTKTGMQRHTITLSVGLLSIAISLLVPRWLVFAGWIYGLLGPLHGFYGYYAGRRMERLKAQSGAANSIARHLG